MATSLKGQSFGFMQEGTSYCRARKGCGYIRGNKIAAVIQEGLKTTGGDFKLSKQMQYANMEDLSSRKSAREIIDSNRCADKALRMLMFSERRQTA